MTLLAIPIGVSRSSPKATPHRPSNELMINLPIHPDQGRVVTSQSWTVPWLQLPSVLIETDNPGDPKSQTNFFRGVWPIKSKYRTIVNTVQDFSDVYWQAAPAWNGLIWASFAPSGSLEPPGTDSGLKRKGSWASDFDTSFVVCVGIFLGSGLGI